VDVQILRLPNEDVGAAIARIGQWGEIAQSKSKSPRAVVVHADRANAKAALFIHHDAADMESVWYADTEMPEIDRGERMTRYATVSAPRATERAMQYVLTSTIAHKAHET